MQRRIDPTKKVNKEPLKEIANRIRHLPYLDMVKMATQISETEVGEEGDETSLSEQFSPTFVADLLIKWAVSQENPEREQNALERLKADARNEASLRRG